MSKQQATASGDTPGKGQRRSQYAAKQTSWATTHARHVVPVGHCPLCPTPRYQWVEGYDRRGA